MTSLIQAPNGTLIRSDRISAVTEVFLSPRGCAVFHVYLAGCEEPFEYRSPIDFEEWSVNKEEAQKAIDKGTLATTALRNQFVKSWKESGLSIL